MPFSLVDPCKSCQKITKAKKQNTVEVWKAIQPPIPIIKIKSTPDSPKPAHNHLVVLTTLFLVTVLCGFYIGRVRKTPKDKAPEYDEKKARHFPLETLGGSLSARLDDETLAHLADSIGYFKSEKDSHILNVPASIEASGDCAGIPALVFFRRKQVRKLIILVDELAEALVWNPIANELYQGLSRLGITCVYAHFRGSPAIFMDDDNKEHFLEDLDNQRESLVLLIFTEGKGINIKEDYKTLEMLSHWQNIAWLELRARSFWDESTALAAFYGIPLYAATQQGLVLAFGRFLTEAGYQQYAAKEFNLWRGVALQGNKNLGFYLEELLEEVLPLAQACSMMQPLSLALIDALRLRFFKNLPPESIEHILKMPANVRAVNGLRFADKVLAVLRSGFVLRFCESEQVDILEFFAEALRSLEPSEKDSLAYLQWQWRYQRLQLELNPDEALKALSALAQSSALKNSILRELENVALADNVSAIQIPLRKSPKTADGRQRLGRLAAQSGIATLEAYPIKFIHKCIFSSLLLAFLSVSVWSFTVLNAPQTFMLSFDSKIENLSLRLNVKQDGKWQSLNFDNYQQGLQWSVAEGKEYQLTASAHKKEVLTELPIGLKNLGIITENLHIFIDAKKELVEVEKIIQDRLKNGLLAPKMVFIQGGEFMMGSPDTEKDRFDNEKQHLVTVGDFYLGQTEVSFADYDVFAKATHRAQAKDEGWGRDKRPVINVDWFDAVAYAEWLSKQTGEQYRLPTEAEWEYAARAGTTTPFSTGECISTNQANYNGNYPYDNCEKGEYRQKTVAVGSFSANDFGLYDMSGNVWEWTCSAYDEIYTGKENKCLSKNNAKILPVLRGGSWYSRAQNLRSANRDRSDADERNNDVGVRLVRM